MAGIRYIRYSPVIRSLLIRSGFVLFFAAGLTALLPLVAKAVKNRPIVYGILLGCFGLGAVLGALAMQHARARRSAEAVVSTGVVIHGLATVAASTFRTLPALCAATLIAGSGWIMFASLIHGLVLNHAADWVRARVLFFHFGGPGSGCGGERCLGRGRRTFRSSFRTAVRGGGNGCDLGPRSILAAAGRDRRPYGLESLALALLR